MKKFIVIVATLVILYVLGDYAYYHAGIYINLNQNDTVTTFTKTEDSRILLDLGNGYEDFEIRGVDIGTGIPGQWSTDFAIDQDTYLRWFKLISEMGANCIRVYTIQSDSFYNAFYEYNKDNDHPLYLLQGVWVNDYVQFSHRDAYDDEFFDQLVEDCRVMLDVLHGNRKISIGRYASAGHGSYLHDVSPWVIGYILGVEWEGTTVAYTDESYWDDPKHCGYQGEYMYTTEDATPFETMLARVGDKVLEYETERYGCQRLVAFSNWPSTDPFEYPDYVASFFSKCSSVDTEHIRCTDAVISGHFASYHVYPYFPDYLGHMDDWSSLNVNPDNFFTEDGELNSYLAYLTMLTEHHTIPVVISEFGIPTGRGMAHEDINTGRNQGAMSESQQGEALMECYRDISAAGCAGSCIFSWQDEWFKRTWNTMHAIDSSRNPYWSDYQTNEQFFGLLTFDPGEEESICYVNGDISEWTEADEIISFDGMTLSMKYDEKFVYFMVRGGGQSLDEQTIYIPIDTTQKSGSHYCDNYSLRFDRAADFLLVIDGRENSRLQVQERYEVLRSTYAQYIYGFDTYEAGNEPDIDSPKFINIDLMLNLSALETIVGSDGQLEHLKVVAGETFETGILTHGNADPDSPDFNSLADFMFGEDCVEIRIPWQLLNFADPSRMEIHDDYYDENYGIDYLIIDELFAGIACGNDRRIPMNAVPLEGWGNDVTYHERLKESYYVMQSLWAEK